MNQWHVAAHNMLELAQADTACVAIATDTNCQQVVVSKHSACGQGRHPSMYSVEAVRTVQEVGGRFAGAADTAHFDDLGRLNREVIARRDDLRGNRIVPATIAKS